MTCRPSLAATRRTVVGGIGMVLHDLMASFYDEKACAVLLIIIVTVVLIDLVSARVRKLMV